MRQYGCSSPVRLSLVLLVLMSVPLPALAGGQEIEARGCFVRVRDKADLSAAERGAIQTLHVRLGDSVQQGQVLVQLDDALAQLALQQAEAELAIATKRHEESQAVQVAEADLSQSEGQLTQARIEARIADQIAKTDLTVQIAEKELELSADELNRSNVVRKAFGGSVSDQQLVKLTIAHSQNQMKVELARDEHELNLLRSQSRHALIEQYLAARDRLQREVQQARSDHAVMELTLKNLATSVAVATEGVRRRQLTAPLSGVVVQQLHHVGEWVEPGDTVLRIIRLDRLVVEGFISAEHRHLVRSGQAVRISGGAVSDAEPIDGIIVFASPEVDSVNREVSVRAEFENPRLALLPGESVRMMIQPRTNPPSAQ